MGLKDDQVLSKMYEEYSYIMICSNQDTISLELTSAHQKEIFFVIIWRWNLSLGFCRTEFARQVVCDTKSYLLHQFQENESGPFTFDVLPLQDVESNVTFRCDWSYIQVIKCNSNIFLQICTRELWHDSVIFPRGTVLVLKTWTFKHTHNCPDIICVKQISSL